MFRPLFQRNLSNQKLAAPFNFVLNIVVLYAGWCLVSYMGENNSNFLWGGWHWLNNAMGNALAFCTAALLKTSGYELIHYKRVITIEGTQGIYIADWYLGLAPMTIFCGIILLYGDNLRGKLLFILTGLAAIFFINVILVTVFALAQFHHNNHLQSVSEYLYVAVTYVFIFSMVIWLMKNGQTKPSTQGVQ